MVEINCDRICAVLSEFTSFTILFITVFMPCDTYNNTYKFNSVLSGIQALQAKYNPVYMICGGDFNTDLSGNGSEYTISLVQFCLECTLKCIYSCSNNIKFTYFSDMNK